MNEIFSLPYAGEQVAFRPLCARGQLSLRGDAQSMLPVLSGLAAGQREAYALACNCALLARVLAGANALPSPEAVLDRLTLGQIADLARLYCCHGDAPDSEWDEAGVVETGGGDV